MNSKQIMFRKMTKFGIILLFLVFFLILGFSFTDNKAALATTRLDNSALPGDSLEPIIPMPANPAAKAPEPGTLALFLGGVGGMIVRFARKSYDKFKRITDILLSVLGIVFTSPIVFFAGIFIKLNSRGPVLYRQSRVGKNGQIFRIYKLRTMQIDAEKETGAVWAKANDRRITYVGRALRKMHIDEIPQLINVLTGEMSIVGPRPERPEMVRDFKNFICDYEKRLKVKPGITGVAQVWHKYDETVDDVKKKIKYDLLYIRKICLSLDLKIMLSTIALVLTGKGAR
jgi:lipopolysaccharide/colanic/teichoic acid biosynthesis glycosyltransferase